jgi:hypothetical protein
MDFLRSSILGKEFVNFRKNSFAQDRVKFSNTIRKQGMGNIPVVIDSVDSELSKALSQADNSMFSSKIKNNTLYGREFVFHMDLPLSFIVFHIKEILSEKHINIGLEDGTFPDVNTDLGTLYKNHRNENDKILYLLATREKNMYDYIISILQYLKKLLFK